MKSIVVEDKEYIRKGLINMLSSIDANVEVIGECESVQEAVIVTKSCKPELVFLDINLSDGTAFDFLEKIETVDFKIIFITAYEEYALKALKIGAVDYLLKPVDIEELKAKMCLAITEDTNFENVKVITDFEFNNETYMLEFEAEYEDEDKKELRTWYLEKTALY